MIYPERDEMCYRMGKDDAPLGVTRSLTEVFTLLRGNTHHVHFSYANDGFGAGSSRNDERMSLVQLEDGHDTVGVNQPMWTHTADEVSFEYDRIRSRMQELQTAQQKHISRPNFGDEAFEAEEKRMEGITEQITSMIAHCQRLINMISNQAAQRETRDDKLLRQNAVSSLLFTLGELTNSFRSRQSKYLNDIKKRTRNIDDFLITAGTDDMYWTEIQTSSETQEFTMDQIEAIMLNEKEVKEREKEVLAVNSSIVELNTLFKDISVMVIDQGTILDRIDYNVEQASVRVSKAVDSVAKAERHQRADKKMHCIFLLAIAIIFVLLLIIFTKF